MSISTNPQTATETAKGRIFSLLNDLPPENLTIIERFVQFLREQARRDQPIAAVFEQKERPPYLYPTVPLPASVLDGLIGIMPPVEGDALADTEALYDEV